jgi:membrane protease YdiL (CAAX protease family)
MALWVVLSVTAGICEEAVYRGYLQKQFMALTKSVPAGIFFPALAFGAAHSYQGWARASLIGVMGAMSGILAYWCGSVRPGMIAHTLQDVLGGFVRH